MATCRKFIKTSRKWLDETSLGNRISEEKMPMPWRYCGYANKGNKRFEQHYPRNSTIYLMAILDVLSELEFDYNFRKRPEIGRHMFRASWRKVEKVKQVG